MESKCGTSSNEGIKAFFRQTKLLVGTYLFNQWSVGGGPYSNQLINTCRTKFKNPPLSYISAGTCKLFIVSCLAALGELIPLICRSNLIHMLILVIKIILR